MNENPKPQPDDESETSHGIVHPAENSGKTAVRGRPFAKGKSGNPGGRPRLEAEIRRLAQLHAGAAILRIAALTRSSNSRVALAACLALIERAIGSPARSALGDSQLKDSDYGVFSEKTHDAQKENDAAEHFARL